MSIYVIDDHPLMRDAIVMVLRRLRPAENIVELERLDKLASSVQQRGAPTLFCLDLKLPDTNGVSGVGGTLDLMAALMPMTRPSRLTSGPPELPGLIAASVCKKSSYIFMLRLRPLALTMPLVTEPARPNGARRVSKVVNSAAGLFERRYDAICAGVLVVS